MDVVLEQTEIVVPMQDIKLRAARAAEAAFALALTDARMRVYAEQTWGIWDGRADFDVAHDQVIRRGGVEFGVFGVERQPE